LAHVVAGGNEVTVLAPLTHDLLAAFVPGLGDVNFTPVMGHLRTSHLPPPVNAMDFRVRGVYPVTAPHWESPDKESSLLLLVNTRLSAVLGIVFGQKQQWGGIRWRSNEHMPMTHADLQNFRGNASALPRTTMLFPESGLRTLLLHFWAGRTIARPHSRTAVQAIFQLLSFFTTLFVPLFL
jgi:hypothetical protein